jgi:predicted NodU family carbamoyl transferase
MIVLGFSGIANGDAFQRRYGLRFVGHDAAVALVVDGDVVFAVEEERLSRRKHTSAVPVHAVRAALDHAGIRLADLDGVAYPWTVTPAKLAHMLLHHPARIRHGIGPSWEWPASGSCGSSCRPDARSAIWKVPSALAVTRAYGRVLRIISPMQPARFSPPRSMTARC